MSAVLSISLLFNFRSGIQLSSLFSIISFYLWATEAYFIEYIYATSAISHTVTAIAAIFSIQKYGLESKTWMKLWIVVFFLQILTGFITNHIPGSNINFAHAVMPQLSRLFENSFLVFQCALHASLLAAFILFETALKKSKELI